MSFEKPFPGWDLVINGEVAIVKQSAVEEIVTPSLFTKKGCKKVGCDTMMLHLSEKFDVKQELLEKSNYLEQLLIQYCVEKLSPNEIDIADVVRIGLGQNTRWGLSQQLLPDFLNGFIIFELPTLTAEQRTEIVRVLQNQFHVDAFTQEFLEDYLAKKYENITLCNYMSQCGFKNLVFISIADFCNKIVPLLVQHQNK